MIDKKTSRRDFLRTTAILVGASAVTVPAILNAQEKRKSAAGAGPAMVDEKSPEAVGVKYIADASKGKDKALVMERGGVPYKDQKCGNCAMYQGKAGDASGPCPIFPGKNVSAKGMCTSWVKKA